MSGIKFVLDQLLWYFSNTEAYRKPNSYNYGQNSTFMIADSKHKFLLLQIVFTFLMAMLDALSSICPQIKQTVEKKRVKRKKLRHLENKIKKKKELSS